MMKQTISIDQLPTSNSTVVIDKGSENLQVQGSNPFSWGLWERVVPDQMADDLASQRILEIHLRRYQTAADYVSGKRVLDIACGAGYGSWMLRGAGAIAVVGVDLSPETVQYAQQNYQIPGVEFVCANAEQFESSEHFDVVVSFETLEHLHHPKKFLERIRNLLVPGGNLLLSVPLGETRHFDPYHLHAFSQEDVFALLEQTGFSVEYHRCDDCFWTRFELLRWGQLYPESRPSVGELLFTRRGWKILQDFVIQGGFNFPELLIVARANASCSIR